MLLPTNKNISTVTDLRVKTIKLLKQVETDGFRYVFQRSTPKAVLLSIETYQNILDRLEDHQDQLLVKKLEKESKGQGINLSKVAQEYDVNLSG